MSLVSKKSLFKSAARFADNFPLLDAGQLCMPTHALGATVAPTYGADGNMITDGEGKTYTWDAENRLIAVTLPNGEIVKYTYDAGSHRVKREHLSAGNVETTPCAYDGWNVIAEKALLNSSFLNLKCYTWGLDLSDTVQGAGGVGGLLCRDTYKAGAVTHHRMLTDGRGNITGIVDAAGKITTQTYDVFGNVTKPGDIGNFGFSTKYSDKETGLIYYGFRYYNPKTGKWLSRDPLGVTQGINITAFVSNSPTMKVDAPGLAEPCPPKNPSPRPQVNPLPAPFGPTIPPEPNAPKERKNPLENLPAPDKDKNVTNGSFDMNLSGQENDGDWDVSGNWKATYTAMYENWKAQGIVGSTVGNGGPTVKGGVVVQSPDGGIQGELSGSRGPNGEWSAKGKVIMRNSDGSVHGEFGGWANSNGERGVNGGVRLNF